MADFIVLLDNFAEIVKNAKPIEAHTDKYSGGVRGDANLLRTFVLLSAFEDGGRIVPVSFRIKQFNEGNYSSDNKIHMAVTLHEISKGSMVSATAKASNDAVPVAVHASDISILDLLKNINPKDKNFLKYVPESWRSGSEAVPESDSDKRFSLRTPAEVKTELLRNRDNDEAPRCGRAGGGRAESRE